MVIMVAGYIRDVGPPRGTTPTYQPPWSGLAWNDLTRGLQVTTLGIMDNWPELILFGGGSSLAACAAYVLGRMGRSGGVRETWVLGEDLGPLGVANCGEYRSRTNAEQARRRWMNSGKTLVVMPYKAWLDQITTTVHTNEFWDALRGLIPSQAQTTILPVLSDQNPDTEAIVLNTEATLLSLAEISLQIAGIANRMNGTDQILGSMLRVQDEFRDRIIDIEDSFKNHAEKVGHITAGMRVFTDAAQDASDSTRPLKLSGTTGRPLIRSTRGLIGLGGEVEERGENLLSGAGTVEGSD